MLLFNLEKLEKICNRKSELLQQVLHSYYYKIPKKGIQNKLDKAGTLAGFSFLLNPKDILNDKTTDILYIAQYIRLAAKRDYTLYKLYNIRYLDLSFYPDIDINKINHNPLLHIATNKVYFKYEEPNGNFIQ